VLKVQEAHEARGRQMTSLCLVQVREVLVKVAVIRRAKARAGCLEVRQILGELKMG
jgi:hypothetical protein